MAGNNKSYFWSIVIFTLISLFFMQIGAPAADCLVPGTAAPAFTVVSGDGVQLSLDRLLGKVVMLFYDNKDAVEKTRNLKDALTIFRNAQPPAKRNILVGIPVIDCSGTFFLFANIWKQQLVKASQREGLTIYADWDGKMKKAYQVVDKDTNFFLIDQDGIVRYSIAGQADSKAIDTILKIMKQLLIANSSEIDIN